VANGCARPSISAHQAQTALTGSPCCAALAAPVAQGRGRVWAAALSLGPFSDAQHLLAQRPGRKARCPCPDALALSVLRHPDSAYALLYRHNGFVGVKHLPCRKAYAKVAAWLTELAESIEHGMGAKDALYERNGRILRP